MKNRGGKYPGITIVFEGMAGILVILLFGVPIGVFALGLGFWKLVKGNHGTCSVSPDRDRSGGPAWWEPVIIAPFLMLFGAMGFGVFLDAVFGTCLTRYCMGWG